MPSREGQAVGFAVQPFGGPHAGHAAAADAGDAEDRDLLGEEIDDLEVVVEHDALVRAARARPRARRCTPAMPSKRPPSGTVSEWRAEHDRAAAPGAVPARRPIRLPAASMRVTSPASWKRLREPGAALEEHRREGAAGPGAVRLGDRGERVDVLGDAGGVDGQIGVMAHHQHLASGMLARPHEPAGAGLRQHGRAVEHLLPAEIGRADRPRQLDAVVGRPADDVVARWRRRRRSRGRGSSTVMSASLPTVSAPLSCRGGSAAPGSRPSASPPRSAGCRAPARP